MMSSNSIRMDSRITSALIVGTLLRGDSLNALRPQMRRKSNLNLVERLFALVLLLFASSAIAETPVSGAIAVNTHWASANSPYLLSGDVVVQNGAVLTIDSGVTIYMAANASLTIQAGSIQGIGTAANPIRVLSDKTRLAQNAAPGDWKQWMFNPGTFNTRLDHVQFEHGSGLVIHGSAPVLNYIDINNHQGAAISIDLAASPTGVGNQATGNDINGIVVPSGDITGNVKWGLRGIPYVVDSGVVSVGVSPSITSITPNKIQQGATTNIIINGSRLTGLVSAKFDNSALTAQVQPGATDTQASLTLNAASTATIGPVNAHFLADAGEIEVADAVTVVPTQPVLSSLSPSSLYLGQGVVDVLVNGTNFTSQSSIQVNGDSVSTQFQSSTQLKTSISTPATADNLHIRVQTPDPFNPGQYLTSNEIVLPVVPGQLVLSPSTITATKGFTKDITLTLPYPAGTGGVVIDLVSSVPTVGSVPSTVTVPAGQTSASFTFNANNVGDTVITASKLGFASGQTQIAVVPPPTLTITPNSLTLGVGRTASLTLQSSVPAGAGGLSVSLNSSNADVATVPSSITIPEGSNSVSFTVSTVAIGTANIHATANEFASGSTAITVRPISLNLPSGVLVAPGLSRSVPLVLSDPAPAGGLEVTLASNSTTVATVPVSLTVPEGQSSANFTLSGVSAGTSTVSASAQGYQSASMLATIHTVTIGIGNPAVSSITLLPDDSKSFAITLSSPAPTGGVTVKLATGDNSIASVLPDSITIAEGQTSGGVVQANLTGLTKGDTTLTASAAGLNSASVPVTVLDKPYLALASATGTSMTVGQGMRTYVYDAYVYRGANGGSYSFTDPVTVNLTSSDPSKISVPASVTIPANQTYAYFEVTGVGLTDGTPVTVDAIASGYTAPATKLSAQVVSPVLNISGLRGNRTTADERDPFSVSLTVPGAAYYVYYPQTLVADLPVDVAIVNADPAGIVDGIYSDAAGGTAVTQVLIPQGSYGSNYAYVGTPTAAGTYQVQASATGADTATSAVQTVEQFTPYLALASATGTSMTVGQGMRTYVYDAYVYRGANGGSYSFTDPVTVNLSCSSSVICSVPATVTIPAGSTSAYFQVDGLGFGSTTITASAVGYESPANDLAVNVVLPQLNFSGPSDSSVGGVSNFTVYLSVPGGYYWYYQSAINDFQVDLTSSEPSVATVPSSVIIPMDSASSNTVQLMGVATGTTTLTASGLGLVSANSNVITINP
jgi:hypothetical protein